jgi:hypothetical protein
VFTTNVNFLQRPHLLFAALAAALLCSSCQEKISSIGSPFVPDSVVLGSHSFRDSALKYSPIEKPLITVYDRNYNLNYSSPYLFFGTVPGENLKSWAILKIPFIQDSVGTLLDDSLTLTMPTFFYGPAGASEVVDFSVYVVSTIGDTITQDPKLVGLSVAHFSGPVRSDTTAVITLRLDTSVILPLLKTTSLALAIVPEKTMTAIRAISSNENGTTANQPILKLTASIAGVNHFSLRNPEYDYHIVEVPQSGVTAETFELRGAAARRERIVIDTKSIRESLGLTPFVTINKASLDFTYDASSLTRGAQPADSSYPQLIYRVDTLLVDTVAGLASYANPLGTTLRYSIQTYIEYAVRHNLDSLTFELWTGLAGRSFGGTSAGAEDYNLNHWVLYNNTAADQSKRPRLSIIYSYLK